MEFSFRKIWHHIDWSASNDVGNIHNDLFVPVIECMCLDEKFREGDHCIATFRLRKGGMRGLAPGTHLKAGRTLSGRNNVIPGRAWLKHQPQVMASGCLQQMLS